jgi:hypothetical protein
MAASINIIGNGCVTVIRGKCRSKQIYSGPFDDSDGMVPLLSSKLEGVDSIVLEGVDHGETVLAMPYKNIDKVKMTDTSLKLLLRRID